ncbi:MAG TPA: hypothetical protein VGK11_05235 [Actinomycetota bacterium]
MQAGNLFVTFDEFISAWIATIHSRVHHAVQAVLGTGEGVYDVRNGPERLGDFNAIGRDPPWRWCCSRPTSTRRRRTPFQQSVHTVQEV